MTTDLFIIAAGKGSRMGGTLPKALVPINENEPNITTTLKQTAGKFNHTYVVINELIIDAWEKYIAENTASGLLDNVSFVGIASGLGDGHAVLSALEATEATPSDEVVILWGDTFLQHSETIDEMLSKHLSAKSVSGLVPAVMESDPYVTLLVDGALKIASADFSKYGEKHPNGWHDQSIFYFKRAPLFSALLSLNAALWKNGRYITPGGELSMLFAFHYLYNNGEGAAVYETDYPTLSFNTPEEVASIQKEISEKWKTRQFL
jgi:bifunctional N-acetylglucosamine-1-phosphate-uridyltransferase/glucosamine-1-phosphate-acetyltransferase GlmU-like protein